MQQPEASTRARLPLFTSLRGYRHDWRNGDVIAGLTVWAVLVPEALAYATIAGVSPVVGLYAAPPALLYAAFGRSRHLITGPMAATAALSAAAVADLVTRSVGRSGPVSRLHRCAGPHHGGARAGSRTAAARVPRQLHLRAGAEGVHHRSRADDHDRAAPEAVRDREGEGNFFEQAWHFVANLGDTQWRTLAVGAGSLVLVLVLREVAPKVPGSLVAVILGVLLVQLFDLDAKGVDIVGDIDAGLPSIGLPDGVDFSDYLSTAGAAVGVMLVGFAESLGAGKTYASKFHYDIDPNRELIALGAANIGSGLSSGMVVNGSLSKTAVNGSAGAHTQLSGIVCAAMTVITLLFLTGLFEQLPEATLGAVVIAALIELVDFPALAELHRLYTRRLGRIYGHAARPDFIAAMAAMFGMLVFDTLPGLFIGIGVSFLLLLYRSSKPHIAELGEVPGAPGQYGDRERHPENQTPPGIVVRRVEGGLFFANADAVRRALLADAARPGTTAVILDGELVPFVDVTAARMLRELADSLESAGVRFALAHDVGQVRDVLDREAGPTAIPLYPTVQSAVEAIRG